jgi:hypothetical protein
MNLVLIDWAIESTKQLLFLRYRVKIEGLLYFLKSSLELLYKKTLVAFSQVVCLLFYKRF